MYHEFSFLQANSTLGNHIFNQKHLPSLIGWRCTRSSSLEPSTEAPSSRPIPLTRPSLRAITARSMTQSSNVSHPGTPNYIPQCIMGDLRARALPWRINFPKESRVDRRGSPRIVRWKTTTTWRGIASRFRSIWDAVSFRTRIRYRTSGRRIRSLSFTTCIRLVKVFSARPPPDSFFGLSALDWNQGGGIMYYNMAGYFMRKW